MSRTKLILLGTGTPTLAPGTAQSAAVVMVDDTPYVIDCGSGILQRLAEARAMGFAALVHEKLTRLFITHLHPDHTLGLPSFIIAEWVKQRRDTVQIWGPRGIAPMAHGVLDLYRIGIEEHLYRGSVPLEPIHLDVTEYQAGIVYQDELVQVEAFRVDHGSLEAYGLKFTTPDKTIVFSGDTCAVPIMIEQAKGCDILVHEVYCEAGMVAKPQLWRDYFARVHTPGKALGEIASQAQPKQLILTHQMMYGSTQPDDLIREIRVGGYMGEVVYGYDLDVFG